MQEQGKRESGISSYVGFNPEQEEDAAKHFQSKFAQFGNQRMEKLERKKTEGEVKIIEDIISKMPEFIAQWEGSPITGMTPRHIYIIEEGKLKEETRKSMPGMRSVYLPREECVLFFHSVNNLDYAISIAHELIHFNSFQSVQPKKSANREIKKEEWDSKFTAKQTKFYFLASMRLLR